MDGTMVSVDPYQFALSVPANSTVKTVPVVTTGQEGYHRIGAISGRRNGDDRFPVPCGFGKSYTVTDLSHRKTLSNSMRAAEAGTHQEDIALTQSIVRP